MHQYPEPCFWSFNIGLENVSVFLGALVSHDYETDYLRMKMEDIG